MSTSSDLNRLLNRVHDHLRYVAYREFDRHPKRKELEAALNFDERLKKADPATMELAEDLCLMIVKLIAEDRTTGLEIRVGNELFDCECGHTSFKKPTIYECEACGSQYDAGDVA